MKDSEMAKAEGSVIVYHRTNAASQILDDGFRDGSGRYLTDRVWRGVWLSDRPLDENEGATGNTVLFVEIPDEVVARFEWVQDIGYREFLLPAEIANRYPICMCSICDDCGSEYGGDSCWWCRAHGLGQS